jgi:hypothetical protein
MHTHLVVAQGDLPTEVWPRTAGASAAGAAKSRRRSRGSLRRPTLPDRCQEEQGEGQGLRRVCK